MSRVQVLTDKPAGGGDQICLDEIAEVQGLVYETTYPGGCSNAHWQMNLKFTANHRAWDYGRRVILPLGAGVQWVGYLDNPDRSGAPVWAMTAIGNAAQTKLYVALAEDSGNALILDEVTDAAIDRGLLFTRPADLPIVVTDVDGDGISATASAPSASMYLDEALDQVMSSQTDETYWQVDVDGVLTADVPPTSPSRIIYLSVPGGGRNLSGFLTDAFVIYQSASGVLSVEQRTVTDQPFGHFEAPLDRTALGLIATSQADAYGDNFLAKNAARAKFTAPMTVTRGQLTTKGGVPVDLAGERAGFLANVVLTDPDSAGEVALAVIPRVLIGGTSYDVDADVLTLTPTTIAADSLTALLGAGGYQQ